MRAHGRPGGGVKAAIRVGDIVEDQAHTRYGVIATEGEHLVVVLDERWRRFVLTRRVLRKVTDL